MPDGLGLTLADPTGWSWNPPRCTLNGLAQASAASATAASGAVLPFPGPRSTSTSTFFLRLWAELVWLHCTECYCFSSFD